MPPSFSVALSYMASERPHSAAPSTWARMLSGCTCMPTSVATVSFLTLTSPDGATATWATQAVQLAVARSCDDTQATPLGRPAGPPHALALRHLGRAITGQTHRGEQGVAEALRAAVVLAGAVEQ